MFHLQGANRLHIDRPGHIFLSCILTDTLYIFIVQPCVQHIPPIIISVTVQGNKTLSITLLSFLQSAATSSVQV